MIRYFVEVISNVKTSLSGRVSKMRQRCARMSKYQCQDLRMINTVMG